MLKYVSSPCVKIIRKRNTPYAISKIKIKSNHHFGVADNNTGNDVIVLKFTGALFSCI